MICRALFDDGKLVFAFMIAANIKRTSGEITPTEWRIYMVGAGEPDKLKPPPGGSENEWLRENKPSIWNQLVALEEQHPTVWTGISDHVKSHASEWYKHFMDTANPHEAEPLGPWA